MWITETVFAFTALKLNETGLFNLAIRTFALFEEKTEEFAWCGERGCFGATFWLLEEASWVKWNIEIILSSCLTGFIAVDYIHKYL